MRWPKAAPTKAHNKQLAPKKETNRVALSTDKPVGWWQQVVPTVRFNESKKKSHVMTIFGKEIPTKALFLVQVVRDECRYLHRRRMVFMVKHCVFKQQEVWRETTKITHGARCMAWGRPIGKCRCEACNIIILFTNWILCKYHETLYTLYTSEKSSKPKVKRIRTNTCTLPNHCKPVWTNIGKSISMFLKLHLSFTLHQVGNYTLAKVSIWRYIFRPFLISVFPEEETCLCFFSRTYGGFRK